MFYCNTPNLSLYPILSLMWQLPVDVGHILYVGIKEKQLSIIQFVSPWQSYESSL